jgi:hypothetical protein
MRLKYTELKFMTVIVTNLIKTLQSKTNTFTQNPIRIISPNLNSITHKLLNLKSLKQNNTPVPFKQKHIKTKNNNQKHIKTKNNNQKHIKTKNNNQKHIKTKNNSQIPKKQLTTLNIKTKNINKTLNTIKNPKK